jgi:hypothetical protein
VVQPARAREGRRALIRALVLAVDAIAIGVGVAASASE